MARDWYTTKQTFRDACDNSCERLAAVAAAFNDDVDSIIRHACAGALETAGDEWIACDRLRSIAAWVQQEVARLVGTEPQAGRMAEAVVAPILQAVYAAEKGKADAN